MLDSSSQRNFSIRNHILLALVGFSLSSRAGVNVLQNVSPGATTWPGAPVITTLANPSTATVSQNFTNNILGSLSLLATNYSQTFTVLTTNYILQTIDIYAGGGTGTGPGTNLTLNLFDLGIQNAPNPTPYGRQAYPDIVGGNLFGSGTGLSITYTNQTNGVLEFDFTGSDQVLLQAGHVYAFELTGPANTLPVNWQSITNSNPYSKGAAYLNQDWCNFGARSNNVLAVAIYATSTANVPPVPTPLAGACTADWNDVRQRIDGFGASSAFRGSGFTTAQADLFFSTNTGMGLSLMRNQIQEGGFASAAEIGIMQQAQARGARVWSSPWSPQPSFKVPQIANGGNFAGGSPTNLAYAQQLASYLVTMKNQGINIYALSVQNEPDTINSSYATCGWNAQQIHDFVTDLYPTMVASNVTSTKIMIAEGVHWQTAFYTTTMNDPTAAAMVGVIACHNYDGINNDPAATIPAAITNYGRPLWETEVAALTPSGGTDSSIQNGIYWAGRIHAFMTVAQANAWHHWWLVYGNSTPNQGLTEFGGSTLAKRGYVLGQFSRFVRPNFYRIGVVTNQGPAWVSAYKDTNSNTIVIVAINPNATNSINQTFTLTNSVIAGPLTPWITSSTLSLASQTSVGVSSSSFTYALPPLSVVTFVGQAAAPNTPPTLTPIVDQTINAGITLVITNAATDTDQPPQNLTFSLLSAPANATLMQPNNTNAVFTWRPPVNQAGTTNPITVKVADSGVPVLSATNKFNVIVNPLTQPVVSSIAVSSNQTSLVVTGALGPDYTLWASTNLVNWQSLFTSNSPGIPVTLVDTNFNAFPLRFYRVQLGP